MPKPKRPQGVYGKRISEETHRPNGGAVVVDYDIYLDGGTLTAYCPEFKLMFSDANISTLRKTMNAAIDEKVSFTWEPWLKVEVTDFQNKDEMFAELRREHEKGTNMKLEITVTPYEQAQRNGKWYHRAPGSGTFREGRVEGHERQAEGQYGGMTEGRDYVGVAVIRDTPEARAALEQLQASMTALSAKVMDVLSQNKIEKSLKALAAGSSLLLAAPKNK